MNDVAESLDPFLSPSGRVRIAVFDGENADPANGQAMGHGVRAYTPRGEVAYALAGTDGYEPVRQSDDMRVAPGAKTLRELFGGEPTLILLDELPVYPRKVTGSLKGRGQLTAFLTALFKAAEGEPRAALVYTLAIGKGGRAMDAFSDENQFIADTMAEVPKVAAHKATLLNPTEEYSLPVPDVKEPVRVTTDPEYFDQHADSLELWSPGNPLFKAPRLALPIAQPPVDTTLKSILDG